MDSARYRRTLNSPSLNCPKALQTRSKPSNEQVESSNVSCDTSKGASLDLGSFVGELSSSSSTSVGVGCLRGVFSYGRPVERRISSFSRDFRDGRRPY